MNTWNDIEQALADLNQRITEATTAHAPVFAGLDPRAGLIHLGEDFIATRTPQTLEYYTGFGYIDLHYKRTIGQWTIYSIEEPSERVQRAILTLEHNCD